MDRDAEAIFEDWLARREDDDDLPFEELLEQHPAVTESLRRLHREWSNLRELQARLLATDPDEEGEAVRVRADSDVFRGPGSVDAHGDVLAPGAHLGPFELECEVGRGAMGVVWRARDRVLGARVALKFLPHVLATDRLAMLRLRREAQILLKLTHQNIVRLRTIDSRKGLTFLVEEFLAGPNLDELVEERVRDGKRGLSPERVRRILEQVAPALDYAHGEGVTHRDIKPSNLMLDDPPPGELESGEERIKLTDFGLAFVASSALSQISTYRPSGTLPYMAPEVLMGRKPTPAADIYSLGATAYDLIAGEPPFPHGDISTQILHRRPDRLRSGDDRLDAAVAAALAKNPADRPASGEDLLAILRGDLRPRRPWSGSVFAKVLAGSVLASALAVGAWTWPWTSRSEEPTTTAAETEVGPERVDSPAVDAEAEVTPSLYLDSPFDEDRPRFLIGRDPGALVLEGTVADPGGGELVVLVDSKRLPVEMAPDGSFRVVESLLSDQTLLVRIEVAGKELRRFEVLLDAEPPRIVLDAPESSPWETDRDSFDLRVRLEDAHPGDVRLDETPLTLAEDGAWVVTAIPLRLGANTWNLVGRDEASNETRQELVVVYTTSGPSLAAVQPDSGSITAWREGSEITLSFTDPVEAAWLDEIALRVDDDGRVARGTLPSPSAPGWWTVQWGARDRAGIEMGGELAFRAEVRSRGVEIGDTALEILDATPGGDRHPRRVRDARTGIVFRLVEPGAFRMGRRPGTGRIDEEPMREVHISKPFYLAETEVTVAQWRRFAREGANSTSAERSGNGLTRVREGKGAAAEHADATWITPLPAIEPIGVDECPVTQISWNDARAFCDRYFYRLPSEAEWEYACRSGREDASSWGDEIAEAEGRGNFADRSIVAALRLPTEEGVFGFEDGFAFTAPVGSYAPNEGGFFDMLGNVWEWCEDAYDPIAYREEEFDRLDPALEEVEDPLVDSDDGARPRVLRGGSWMSGPPEIGCARRAMGFPDRGSDVRGFRPAFTPGEQGAAPPESRVMVGKEPMSLVLVHRSGKQRLQCEMARDLEGNLRLNGGFESFHVNGDRAEGGELVSGVREGRWTGYHPNGERQYGGRFRADLRHKSWVYLHSDGSRRAQGSYLAGVRHGEWKFFEGGEPDTTRGGIYEWAEDEDASGLLLDGRRHGPWTYRWPNGRRRFEGEFVRGRRDGSWRFWHPDGTFDPRMLSGTWKGDERIAAATAAWRPSTPDYAPPQIALGDLGDAEAWNLPAPPEEQTAIIAEAMEATPDALLSLAARLTDDRRGAYACLLTRFLRLDLADPEDVERGHRLMQLLAGMTRGRSHHWRTSTSPEDRAFNRLRILRMLSLWLLQRDDPILWKIEFAAAPSTFPEDLSELEPGSEDWLYAAFHEDGLLLLPPERDEWASPPGRWVPRLSNEEAMRRAEQFQAGDCLAGALAWLVRHQSPDGSWDGDAFGDRCLDRGDVCPGPGHAVHDVGLTSLAVLALQGAGNTALEGPHHEAVRRALLWLTEQQDPDTGLIGTFSSAPGTGSNVGVAGGGDPGGGRGGGGSSGGASKPCSTCLGRGWIIVSGDQKRPCFDCNGKGRTGGTQRQFLVAHPPPAIRTGGSANVFDHMIATLALSEAYAQVPAAHFRHAAQRAVGFIERMRNPFGAWRYDAPPIGDNDTAVTGWAVWALVAARDAGLTVKGHALEGALSWLDEASDPATGRCGYDTFGSLSNRTSANDHFPREKGEAMTAVALFARLLLGQNPEEEMILEKHVDLLKRTPPEWDPDGFGCDMFYWCFGTYAMAQMRGSSWKSWNSSLKSAVLDSQRQDGDSKGSWDPIGPWGYVGGRVYSTALMALCLEAPFRYSRDPRAR